MDRLFVTALLGGVREALGIFPVRITKATVLPRQIRTTVSGSSVAPSQAYRNCTWAPGHPLVCRSVLRRWALRVLLIAAPTRLSRCRLAGVEQILSGWAARGSGQVRCKGRRCIARESVPQVACGWREGASSFSPLPHRSGERIVDNLHGERSESRAAAGVCLGTGCGSCKITKCIKCIAMVAPSTSRWTFARGRPEGKHGLPS